MSDTVRNRESRKLKFALPADDKPNHDHEPDNRQHHDRADDLVAGEAHGLFPVTVRDSVEMNFIARSKGEKSCLRSNGIRATAD